MKLKNLKKYKNIITTSIYLFIYILFVIVFIAETIAGTKVQDMDIASLLCTILGATLVCEGIEAILEAYENYKKKKKDLTEQES